MSLIILYQAKGMHCLKMNNKNDIRVIKTRSALNLAFNKLIEKKPFEKISVNEICELANVRRATFYKHFSDKYDFFAQYVGALRTKYDSKPSTTSYLEYPVDYYVDYAKKCIEYIDDNFKTVLNMLGSNQRHLIVGIIAEKNFHDTLEKLKINVNKGMVLPTSTETCAAMLTGGVATAIFHWISTNKEKSVEELTKEVALLVENLLRT